jgi:hypothetical protein
MFLPSSSRLPENTTFAPVLHSAIAVALPISDVPPITKTALFSSIFIAVNLLFSGFKETLPKSD